MQLNNKNFNPWNPFEPTERDIKRTEELGNKAMLVTLFLTIVFPLFGLIYLERAVNCLKIIGKGAIAALILTSFAAEELEEDIYLDYAANGIFVATVIEQAITITQARQRKEDNVDRNS